MAGDRDNSFPALQGLQIFTMPVPLWVILQMTVISGTRMLESRADKNGVMTKIIRPTRKEPRYLCCGHPDDE